MASKLRLFHGGMWCNNIYEGEMKEYIPMQPEGFSYKELITKLEVRLKKDTISNTFDIDALVEDEDGEVIRVKVTDELEWSFSKSMNVLPVLYVNTYPKSKAMTFRPANGLVLAAPLPHVSTFIVLGIRSCPSDVMKRNSLGISQQLVLDQEAINLNDELIPSGQIEFGSVFRNKELLFSALHVYNLKNHFDFRTKVSDPRRYHAACKFELSCVFSLHSKTVGCAWKLYNFIPHTCQKDMWTCSEPRVLLDQFLSMFLLTCQWMVVLSGHVTFRGNFCESLALE